MKQAYSQYEVWSEKTNSNNNFKMFNDNAITTEIQFIYYIK